MDLQTLKEQRAELLAQRKALHEKSVSENREFTTDEQVAFDACKAGADKLAARIKQGETIAAEQAELDAAPPARTLGLNRPTESYTTAGSTLNVRGAPQPWESHVGSLKAFKAAPGESRVQVRERAYAAGQWIAAFLFGKPAAREWCNRYAKQTGIREFALGENVNTAGGFLVPEVLASTIIDLRETYGIARQVCDVMPMTGDTLNINRRTGGITIYPLAESQAMTASDPSWDQISLVAKKWGGYTLIPNELMEDAVIAVADWVAQEFAYGFALKEDQCLFIGDGTSTYQGIRGLSSRLGGTIGAGQLTGAVDAATNHDTFLEIDNSDLATLIGKAPQYVIQGGDAAFYCSAVCKAMVFDRLQATAGGVTPQQLGGKMVSAYQGYAINVSQVCPTSTGDLSDLPMLYFGSMRRAVTIGDRSGIRSVVDASRFREYDQSALFAIERFDLNVHDVGDTSTAGPILALIGD